MLHKNVLCIVYALFQSNVLLLKITLEKSYGNNHSQMNVI